MLAIEQLATAVYLACMTVDRTKEEQRDLLAVARRVDREWNEQTANNPLLRDIPFGECTYSSDHGKGCKCASPPGTPTPMRVRTPRGGWSFLEQEVIETWEPSE